MIRLPVYWSSSGRTSHSLSSCWFILPSPSLGYGEQGRAAVRLRLDRAHQAGLIPHAVAVEFV